MAINAYSTKTLAQVEAYLSQYSPAEVIGLLMQQGLSYETAAHYVEVAQTRVTANRYGKLPYREGESARQYKSFTKHRFENVAQIEADLRRQSKGGK